MKSTMIACALTCSALVAAPALAHAGEPDGAPTVSRAASAGALSSVSVVPSGLAVQLGGGVTAFTREAARDTFKTGGYWDARAILGTRSFLGAEVAYVGSARGVTAEGVSDNTNLLGNGVEATVRGNLPLQLGSLRLEPFVFGGAGWTHYQLVNNDFNRASIKDSAEALVIPFGTGVSLAYQHFTVDARFTYRAIFDDDLVPTSGDDHLDLQNWGAGITLGYEL